ncbi:MAG: PAS domain S-box protein [Verrucomicrobia bacterium]|nr:PAS domain S-box protein [Verrucomicrobiota bacterium]
MSFPIRVLIVEDSEADAALVLRQLEVGGYLPTHRRVETAAAMRAALAEETWDLIVADYTMPHFDAPAALEVLQESGQDIPFIVVSGSIGEDIAVAMMKIGAHDYLLKNKLARFVPAVQRELREAQSRHLRREAEAAKQKLEAERSQLVQRLRQENEDLAALTQVTANAISTLDLEELLRVLLERFVAVMKADTAAILLAEGDELRVRACVGLPEMEHAGYTVPVGQGFTGTIAATRQPLYVEDAQIDPRVLNPQYKRRGVRSMLGVPLKHNGRLVGVLHVHWLTVHPYREREVHLLEITAERCAAAIVNARLYEQTKLAKAALRESETMIRSLLEAAADAVVVTDAEGRITLVNAAAERLFGYARAELSGQPVEVLVPVPFRDAHHTHRRRFAVAGQPRSMGGGLELSAQRKDGSVFPVEISLSPVQIAHGTLVIAIIRDLSERKRAEARLQASEQRYRTLAEAAQDAIFVIDRHFRHQYVNTFAARQAGHTPEAMVGKRLTDVFPPPVVLELQRNLIEVFTTGQPRYVESKLPLSGGEAWLSTRLVPLGNAAGQVEAVLGIARDVTEQKQLEEQLRHAQKMEAIGHLAGGVAHDFNNLLTVIQGFSQLVLSDPHLDAGHREHLGMVYSAAEKAASLTRQLLAFSRKQAMQPRIFDLNGLVDGVAKMLRRLIGEDIALELQLLAEPCPVSADEGMLEQVLVNLAVNARDAMPRGGQLVVRTTLLAVDDEHVARSPEARLGEFVCLSVRDTGCGMTPEVLGRIFEPFFTTKDVGKGTGLGLATVYGIVKQHQGWVEATSLVGTGTTFRIFLPAVSAQAAQPPAGARTQAAPRGTETILLVEDEAIVRTLTRTALERLGYHILEADSGPAALEVWRSQAADIALVLTDLVMPGGLTGFDLAEQLRADHPQLKAIFVSGYSQEALAQASLVGSGRHFLQKPFAAWQLAEAVRNCLDGK